MSKSSSHLSMHDAVEALSSIAALSAPVAAGPKKASPAPHFAYDTVEWLKNTSEPEAKSMLDGLFHSVLGDMQITYGSGLSSQSNRWEKIKETVRLVDSASDKLDTYTPFFDKTMRSSKKLPAYAQIHNYYSELEAEINDSENSGVASLHEQVEELAANHKEQSLQMLLSLDNVRDDRDYELFFLTKDDGTGFFDTRLVKQLQLLGRVGHEDYEGQDFLIHIHAGTEKSLQQTARKLYTASSVQIAAFFKSYKAASNWKLAQSISMGIMALMLAAKPQNLREKGAAKSCSQYFVDFITYLRAALYSDDYEDLAADSELNPMESRFAALELIHTLCRALYTQVEATTDLDNIVQDLVGTSAHAGTEHIAEHLATLYQNAMAKVSKLPNGPLLKTVDLLADDSPRTYDPLGQLNLPTHLYDLQNGSSRLFVLRMPTPTTQENVHFAVVIKEFCAMLSSLKEPMGNKKLLVFNNQDRASWKEYARCGALERIQRLAQYAPHLSVVTMTRDSDFYNQFFPYHDLNDAAAFKEAFQKKLTEEIAGYRFSKGVRDATYPWFFGAAMDTIHTEFFGKQAQLTRKERQAFIEIFYTLLELKIIEQVGPDAIAYTCKDGLDNTLTASTQLALFLKILHRDKITAIDEAWLQNTLFALTLRQRERLIVPERMSRMLTALSIVEKRAQTPGLRKALNSLFVSDILESKIN